MKQQKSEKAFRQAVNKVITDDSRESELLKQKQIIAGCKNKYVNVVSFIFMLLKSLKLSNLSVSSVDFGKNIALLTNHSTPP